MHFFQRIQTQRRILRFMMTISNFWNEYIFWFTLALFANLKPHADKPAQKNEKRILDLYHRIPFYVKILSLSGRLHFVKNKNRCTLLYMIYAMNIQSIRIDYQLLFSVEPLLTQGTFFYKLTEYVTPSNFIVYLYQQQGPCQMTIEYFYRLKCTYFFGRRAGGGGEGNPLHKPG